MMLYFLALSIDIKDHDFSLQYFRTTRYGFRRGSMPDSFYINFDDKMNDNLNVLAIKELSTKARTIKA